MPPHRIDKELSRDGFTGIVLLSLFILNLFLLKIKGGLVIRDNYNISSFRIRDNDSITFLFEFK